MQLNEDGGAVKIFRAAHYLWDSFKHIDIHDAPERVDLCTFMRTILVAAPLALLANAVAVGAALAAVAYFLFALWLWAKIIGFLVVIVAVFATVVGVFWGGSLLIIALAEAPCTREITHVVRTYYRAKKASICPIIEIKGAAQ